MRLTLRTLLAYRDGVLGPKDADEMHGRIHQSEDATNLLRRIESLTSGPQSASPTIVGKGLVSDPNSLAEYLDDTLRSEQVPELERICLESNSYLAELTECHTLLSTALHTRVSVPASLREIAIEIGEPENRARIKAHLNERKQERNGAGTNVRQAARHGISQGEEVGASQLSSATSDVSDPRIQSEERLQSSDAVWVNSQARPEDQPVEVQAPMVTSGGKSIKQQGLNLEGAALAHEVPEYLVGTRRANWQTPLAIFGLLLLMALLVWQKLGPWDRVANLFSALPKKSVSRDVQLSVQDESAVVLQAEEAVSPEPTESSPPGGTNEPTAAFSDSQTSASDLPALSSHLKTRGVDPAIEKPSRTETQEPRSSVDSRSVHLNAPKEKSVSDDSTVWLPDPASAHTIVLAREALGDLQRIAPGDRISNGSILIVPPNNWASIRIADGPVWKTCGPTSMIVNQSAVMPTLCRAIVSRNGGGDRLTLDTIVGRQSLRLGSPDSIAAVEFAYRQERHGSILDRTAFRPTLVIVAVEGDLEVIDESTNDRKAYALAIGEGLAVTHNPYNGLSIYRPFQLTSIPSWFRMGPTRPIDAEAVRELALDLVPADAARDPSVDSALMQLTRHRRPEEAALAIQTSLLAGRWAPFWESGFLSDPRMSIHWGPILDLARQLLAADPAQARALQLIVAASLTDGDRIFEVLCGLPEEQLNGAGLAWLVDQLESDQLVNRVLAFYELQKVTGKKLGFQPSVPNRASILAWRRELATHRLKVVPAGEMAEQDSQ